jgi:MFS family permease
LADADVDHRRPDHSAGDAEASRHAAWYFAGIASFMLPAGIQAVLLPHLLAIELQQPAARFGATQMLVQLPMLVLLLFGGLAADRVDPRRLLMGLQLSALVAPLALAVALANGQVSEGVVLLYAIAWSVVSAFAMPARDGLLNRIAGTQVQQAVTRAMAVQFGAQVIGYGIGGLADRAGVVAVLLTQCVVLLLGTVAAQRLPAGAPVPAATPAAHGAGEPREATGAHEAPRPRENWWRALGGGLALLFADAAMRGTFLLLAGLGVFFAGTFVVLMPLAVRDLYGGTAQDISIGFAVFVLGTLTSIVGLMRRGGTAWPGRALVGVLFGGCAVLAPIAFAPPLWGFQACIFLWGMGGGVAMTMSRTIMQERAPPTHRARVMAAFSLANAGGAPLGSLLMGLAVASLGVQHAVLVPIAGVAIVTSLVVLTHPILGLRSGAAR